MAPLNAYEGLAIVAVVSFVLATAFVPLSMKIATKLGAIDKPSARRVHDKPTPRMGGIALFGGIMGALAVGFVLHKVGIAPSLDFPDNLSTFWIGVSIIVIFAVGAIDDVKQIRARTKLAGQIVAACIAVFGGILLTDIHSGSADIFVAFGIWAYPITVLYLVAFANIINLIDGLDGLAAGVAAISGAAFLVISCQLGIWATATMAVALIASCLAFLRYNFNPAKLFMGDSGSLTLGFILGLVSLMGTMRVSSLTSLAVPVVIAAIPVLDTFAAIVRRKRNHVPISSPDKAHLHHSLLKMGFSQRRVVLTIYGICAVFAISGVVIAGTPLRVRIAVLLLDFVIAALLVWKLGLFGKVMGRYYPDGKPRDLSAVVNRMKIAHGREQLPVEKPKEQEANVTKEARLRVLLLCEHFYPSVDACSKRMTVMEQELTKRGHDVHVLASETSLAEADSSYVVPDNVHFYPTFKMESKTVINRLRNNWSEKTGSELIAKNLGQFDVVLVTSPPLMLTMSGAKIASNACAKLIFDVRDIWPDVAYEMGSFTEGSIYGRVFSYLANRTYKKAAIISTVSKSKVKKLKFQLGEEGSKKVRLVPNGLDLAFLSNEEDAGLIDSYDLLNDSPCVYVGNLGLAQGLSTLLDIAEQRPSVRFLLFGSGAEEALLRSEIELRGLVNVNLCGRVNVSGVYTLLKYARLAYVPLKSSLMVDSVPTKLYEALGCGCPVLLAAQGESAMILGESGLGIAAPPEDGGKLLEAFDRMLVEDWTDERREKAVEYISTKHSRQAAGQVLADIIEEEFGRNDGE